MDEIRGYPPIDPLAVGWLVVVPAKRLPSYFKNPYIDAYIKVPVRCLSPESGPHF